MVMLQLLIDTASSIDNNCLQMILQGKANASDLHDRESDGFLRVHSRSTFVTLSQFNSSEIQRRLETYTKFMFVRHPLERLISAYRSKFQTINKHEFYRREYGREAVARYRANKSSVPPNAPINDVTFEEFTGLVLNPPKLPLDVHWRPMTDLCHPCAVRYDFVGRHENLEARPRPRPPRRRDAAT